MPGPDSTGWYASRRAVLEKYRKEGWSVKGWENYFYTRLQWEIDCDRQQLRILQIVFYDEDKEVIKSADLRGALEDQVPDSNGDGLLRSFCEPGQRLYFQEYFDDTTGTVSLQRRR